MKNRGLQKCTVLITLLLFLSERRAWTNDELTEMKTRFGKHLVQRTLPGKNEIEERKGKVLEQRTWRNIKDYLNHLNRTAVKKMTKSLK